MTKFVPLAVDCPAVFPLMVWKKLCALFQSEGRTRSVAATVAVDPWLLKAVIVPVKSPTVLLNT